MMRSFVLSLLVVLFSLSIFVGGFEIGARGHAGHDHHSIRRIGGEGFVLERRGRRSLEGLGVAKLAVTSSGAEDRTVTSGGVGGAGEGSGFVIDVQRNVLPDGRTRITTCRILLLQNTLGRIREERDCVDSFEPAKEFGEFFYTTSLFTTSISASSTPITTSSTPITTSTRAKETGIVKSAESATESSRTQLPSTTSDRAKESRTGSTTSREGRETGRVVAEGTRSNSIRVESASTVVELIGGSTAASRTTDSVSSTTARYSSTSALPTPTRSNSAESLLTSSTTSPILTRSTVFASSATQPITDELILISTSTTSLSSFAAPTSTPTPAPTPTPTPKPTKTKEDNSELVLESISSTLVETSDLVTDSSPFSSSPTPTSTPAESSTLSPDPMSIAAESSIASASIASIESANAARESSEAQAFVLPGQQLSVLPIGLGIFAGISVLGLVIVGVVTYERKKYRGQFRRRQRAAQIAQAGGFTEK